MTAHFHELDTVVLLRDLPEAGLRSGDLGAVVLVYGGDALEVEFVTASGRTQARGPLAIFLQRPQTHDPRVHALPDFAGITNHNDILLGMQRLDSGEAC